VKEERILDISESKILSSVFGGIQENTI